MMYKSASESTLKISSTNNGTDNNRMPPCFSFYLLDSDDEGETEINDLVQTVSHTTVNDLKKIHWSDSSHAGGKWKTIVRKFKVTKQSILRKRELELKRKHEVERKFNLQRQLEQECQFEFDCELERQNEALYDLADPEFDFDSESDFDGWSQRKSTPDIGDTVENPVGIRTQAMRQTVSQNVFSRINRRSRQIQSKMDRLVSRGGYGFSRPGGLDSLEDELDSLDFYEDKYMREEKKLWHRHPDGSWYRVAK